MKLANTKGEPHGTVSRSTALRSALRAAHSPPRSESGRHQMRAE